MWNAKSVTKALSSIDDVRTELLEYTKGIVDGYCKLPKEKLELCDYDLMLGDWLTQLLDVAYISWGKYDKEKYQESKNKFNVSVPFQTLDMVELSLSDDFHKQFAYCLYAKSEQNEKISPQMVLSRKKYKRAFSRDVLFFLYRLISTKHPKILLCQPYVKVKKIEFLVQLLKWRNWVFMDDMIYPINIRSSVDVSFRHRSFLESTYDESFASFSKAMVPLFLPVVFLESFNELTKYIRSINIRKPKYAAFTGVALHGGLIFKLKMIDWRRDSVQLLDHQHGGYGIRNRTPIEEYERRVSDVFYSWGRNLPLENVKSLTPAVPSKYFRKKSTGKNRILFIMGSYPRAVYRIDYNPSNQSLDVMYKESSAFIEYAYSKINLSVRLCDNDYGYNIKKHLLQISHLIKFDNCKEFYNSLDLSSLVVSGYLGTTWLESMAFNIPTLVIYNPDIHIFNDDFDVLRRELVENNIFHFSGERAAEFVIHLGDNLEDWWYSQNIQKVRLKVVATYARFSSEWQSDWESEFLNISSKPRKQKN